MDIYDGAKKMVAPSHDYRVVGFRRAYCIFKRYCRCAIYLYPVLDANACYNCSWLPHFERGFGKRYFFVCFLRHAHDCSVFAVAYAVYRALLAFTCGGSRIREFPSDPFDCVYCLPCSSRGFASTRYEDIRSRFKKFEVIFCKP